MKRILLIAYWLTVYVLGSEIHQDFVDNVDPSQDEDNPASGSTHHPYVGIPVGTWKMIDLSTVEKDEICSEQQTFCSNECGGYDLTIVNFCNRTTMAWNCKCKNHVPDTPPYGWPSTIAECHGKETACNNGCSSGSTKAICLKACGQYYKCNQAGSPPSSLRVDNENDVPNYSIAGIQSPLNSSNAAVQWHISLSSFVQLSVALTTLIIVIV
ncbi:uncharacterized protein ATC70_000140 [Mucor velutinosus]|uniref:DUF7707 domain-containing protein n=1 Tax=Mucor velutinosus TaxID=708070 RepID=A0AAN7DA63_9FUNG|nr:hypothetical protein ATC70_000140 [Mucor velutinosus]